MAYAMTVHTALGHEKFLLHLPTGENCGSAHMFKGGLEFTEYNRINETYVLSAFSNVPFDCMVRIQCTPVADMLAGTVEIIDPDTGKPMLSCPVEGKVSDNPHPWSEQ